MNRTPRNIELVPGVVLAYGQGQRDVQPFSLAPAAPFALVSARRGTGLVEFDGSLVEVPVGHLLVTQVLDDTHAMSLSGEMDGFVLLADPRRMGTGVCETLGQLGVSEEGLAALVGEDSDYRVLPVSSEASRILARVYPCLGRERTGQLKINLVDLLACLCAQSPEEGVPGDDAGGSHAALARKAHDIMMGDPSKNVTIADLARACGTSATVLKVAFKETYGMPVYAWYRRHRMEQGSRLLLESRISVAEVALAVGYSNPSKFAKAFEDCMGMTPSAWRSVMSGRGWSRAES